MVTAVGLPLLMVNGKFQSLRSMTVEDLETFIPFLAKCSVNRAGAELINGVPVWWPSFIQYKFPLKKPKGLSQIGYRKHLSSIVCQCYWYHNAQYLLPFCAKIASSPDSVFFKSNEDNTTSIFYVHNTIHIMKFNNENKNYDLKPKTDKILKKYLLSALRRKTSVVPDIYLCENCDAEFSSHSEVLKHEKECYEIVIEDSENEVDDVDDSGGGGRSNSDSKITSSSHGGIELNNSQATDTSEDIEIIEHIKPSANSKLGKNDFLNYLQLHSSEDQNLSTTDKTSGRRINAELCLQKNRNIEFSSLFGRKLLLHSVKRELKQKNYRTFLLNESYCCTSVRSVREVKEQVEFKVTCKKQKKRNWCHEYCFNKKQRISRYKTLKTGLNENSRKLLKQCKEFRIVINRLQWNS